MAEAVPNSGHCARADSPTHTRTHTCERQHSAAQTAQNRTQTFGVRTATTTNHSIVAAIEQQHDTRSHARPWARLSRRQPRHVPASRRPSLSGRSSRPASPEAARKRYTPIGAGVHRRQQCSTRIARTAENTLQRAGSEPTACRSTPPWRPPRGPPSRPAERRARSDHPRCLATSATSTRAMCPPPHRANEHCVLPRAAQRENGSVRTDVRASERACTHEPAHGTISGCVHTCTHVHTQQFVCTCLYLRMCEICSLRPRRPKPPVLQCANE